MTANSFIDETLERINQEYEPGTLVWMKRTRPKEWGKTVAIEGKINEMVLKGDMKGLEKVLGEYEGLISTMVGSFKTTEHRAA